MYKQRLNIQMLCFLQQLELINNDFFTKTVRTNYCVPLKSIESTTNAYLNNKQAYKLLQHLFPPPPPLPLPTTNEIFSPSLPHQSDLSNSIRIHPPSSALSFPTRSSPSCHHTILPCPSSPVSKFAQVRDIFARAESTKPIKNHHSIPTKTHLGSSHIISSIEQCSNSKPANVLNAVQEYQRQHINISQPPYKRFIQVNNNSNVNRSPNIGALRPRAASHVGLNNNNNNKFQHKQNLPAYTTPSPQQQIKPITRVI